LTELAVRDITVRISGIPTTLTELSAIRGSNQNLKAEQQTEILPYSTSIIQRRDV